MPGFPTGAQGSENTENHMHYSLPAHESLIDVGACWQCDESVRVPESYRAKASEYQMLFCSEACSAASRRAGNEYGRGLVVKLRARTE